MVDQLFKIKICGITCEDDLMAAVDAGADAIGLNFYQPSVRSVSSVQASVLATALRRRGDWSGRLVGVFVNHSAKVIVETIASVGLDVIQLHGDECPKFTVTLRAELEDAGLDSSLPIVRAVRVAKDLSAVDAVSYLKGEVRAWREVRTTMILLDAAVSGSYGGTGHSLDWHAVGNAQLDLPIALAGGLTPDNVANAIETAKSDAVDVASGVENEFHRKDHAAVRRFVSQANLAFKQVGRK